MFDKGLAVPLFEWTLEQLRAGEALYFNLGTGRGASVREVIEACRRVTGHPITAISGARRPGDPAILVAESSRAKEVLNWQPAFLEIDEIVRSAWQWHQSHPHGYVS